jgi:hypothetical protein
MRIAGYDLTFKRQLKRAPVREFHYVNVPDMILELDRLHNSSATNSYVSREVQVSESIRKYRGMAVKGNLLTRNIIETRTAFTAGRGLNVRWEGEAENKFIKEFLRVNKLNLGELRDLARERCFEGQVLLALNAGDPDGVPRVRFISWANTHYEVTLDQLDYQAIQRVSFLSDPQANLPVHRLAYLKFQAPKTSATGTPLLAGILNQLETLDDALARLNLVTMDASNPTPYFEHQIESDAEAFREYLRTANWKMGDALAGSGKAYMLQIGYGPYMALIEQISMLVKIISGHTSVPAHYIGFAEGAANRSVADIISSAFVTISETETERWGQGFTDLVGRAMAMYNDATGSKLNVNGGRIEVEVINEEDFRRVAAIWMPVWLGGGITTETFLAKIPGVDEKTEAGKVREELAARGNLTPGQALPEERKAALDAMKTAPSAI